MRPRARDFIGAGLLFVVLSGLVAIMVIAEFLGRSNAT
jgi:hypothetical protein